MGRIQYFRLPGRLFISVFFWSLAFGQCFAHMGEHQEIVMLTSALEKDPGNRELLLRRSELKRLQGDLVGSSADLQSLQKLDDELLDVHFGLGLLRIDQGDPAKAISHLDEYIYKRPDDTRALIARARAFRSLGAPLKAVQDYDTVIELHVAPVSVPPDYYLERAQSLYSAGPDHLDEAVTGIDHAIDRLGHVQSLILYAIEIEVESGHYQAAISRIEEIMSSSIRKESWLARKADILISTSRLEEAHDVCEEALDKISRLPIHRQNTRHVKVLYSEFKDRLEFIGHAY